MYFLYLHSNPSPPIPPPSISMLHEIMFQKAIMPVIVRYYTTPNILYHCTMFHYIALHYITLHWTALFFSVLQCSVLHYTVLRNSTNHYTSLNCSKLHHCFTNAGINYEEQLGGSNQHVLIMKLSKRTQLWHFQHFMLRTFLDNLLL